MAERPIDQMLQDYIAKHGPLKGEPAKMSEDRDADGRRIQDPYYKYVFEDGSTLEANAAGQIKSVSEKPAKAPTAVASAPDRQFNPDGSPNKNYVPPAAKPTPTPSDKLEPITDPNTGKVVKLRDPSTGAVIDLPDARTGDRVLTVGRKLVQVQPDGTFNVLMDVPKDASGKQTLKVGSQVYTFDPDTGQYTAGPVDQAAASAMNKPDVVATNTTAPFLVALVPDGNGGWTWQQQANPNRLTVEQAVRDVVLPQLAGKINGPIGIDELKDLATIAFNQLTAQTAQQQAQNQQNQTAINAANGVLTATHQGAATGAGLLNQRVQAGTSLLNNVTSLANNKNFGLGGPLPADLGANITGGIQAFLSNLGGGPEVYQTAANLVKQADPLGGQSPMAQQAYEVLAGLIDHHQGQQQAQAGQQMGTFRAPGAPGAGSPTTTIAPDGTVTVQHAPATAYTATPNVGAAVGAGRFVAPA